MLTGSLVSTIQGEPRSTHDIDIVVSIRRSDAAPLVREFPPPEYYLDEVAVNDAIDRRDMFNLLQTTTGDKIDFWLLKENDLFDAERFGRKVPHVVFGLTVPVSTPEDTIVQKLRWIHDWGAGEKQFIDALRVYEVQFQLLDISYIDRWVARLDLGLLWNRLKVEANPL